MDRLKDHDSSRWLSGKAESTHYYQMDWSSEQTLNNVKVWSGNTPGGVKGAQIDDYTIEYWNGTSWVIAATVVNNSKDGASGRYNDLYFSPVTTSKLRMNITGPSRIDHTARLIEIEVYGDSNPPSDYHDDDEDGNDKGNQR